MSDRIRIAARRIAHAQHRDVDGVTIDMALEAVMTAREEREANAIADEVSAELAARAEARAAQEREWLAMGRVKDGDGYVAISFDAADPERVTGAEYLRTYRPRDVLPYGFRWASQTDIEKHNYFERLNRSA